MAEEQAQIKSEQPTVRRREETRQQGRVAFSNELNSGLLLMCGTLAVWATGNSIGHGLLESLKSQIRGLHGGYGILDVQNSLIAAMGSGLAIVGVVLGVVFVSGFGSSVVQAGVYFAPEALIPKWNRISPFEGWDRVASVAGVMRGVFALVKLGVILLIVGWVLWGKGPHIASFGEGTLAQSATSAWAITIRLLLAISAALVLVGLADYAFQRHRFEESIMMSRHELKEELKRDEGDPQLRGRRRQRARELAAQRRMLEEVPEATVVVTNPTHLAIAMKYERGTMSTPKVVAKGEEQLARRIVELAKENNVPVVERKPVAQALFQAVKVGEEIPVVLFYAVSEILAYVYRLQGKTIS